MARSDAGLGDRHLRGFGRDGFTVVKDVFAPDLCEAARAEIEQVRAESPEPEGHHGFHFYWSEPGRDLERFRELLGSMAARVASGLVAPHAIGRPELVQISLVIPPWKHRPGGPHLDGCTPPEPDGRPGTFTALAGVLLTDQPAVDMGNLWVWPGTHLTNAEYLRREGSDALMATAPYPPTPLPEPKPIFGHAGDLFLGHYLLGHNMGGNVSETTRETVYFRLHTEGHRTRWRTCVKDALHEFVPVRAALDARPDEPLSRA